MRTLEAPKFGGEKKPEKKETEVKYHFSEIAELEKPMESLAEQLKEAIDKGEYDTLISDDAGGRIPTLVFREIMMARMRKNHPEFKPEQEREALKTYFVAGGRAKLNVDAVKELFNKAKLKSKKVLLVTEFMESGYSIRKLGDLLDSAKIDFDIVSAMSAFDRDQYHGDLYVRHHLFIGKDKTRVAPEIYGLKSIMGVEKEFSLKGAYLKTYNPAEAGDFTIKEKKRILQKQSERILEAREDVKLMAKKILEKVWGK